MSNVTAEVRIRPSTTGVLDTDGVSVTVGGKTFTFSRVHTTTTQTRIFQESVGPLLNTFLDGRDCAVLAYGQTGSGKTYTMGISTSSRGAIVQQALERLFKAGCKLGVTFMEIHNDDVIDLLGESRVPLSVRQTGNTVTIVGLSEHTPESCDDAMRLLRDGCAARSTACTRMNAESSRSHAIFTVHLRQQRGAAIVESQLAFVDLAGSERLKRTGCAGGTAREAISINGGLLALGNVINALYLRKAHIPYRDSKLTRILARCLGSHLLLIACISPEAADLFETANTLKYASRAAQIAVEEKIHITSSKDKVIIDQLKREISKLKDENMRLREARRVQSSPVVLEAVKKHPFVLNLIKQIENMKKTTVFNKNEKHVHFDGQAIAALNEGSGADGPGEEDECGAGASYSCNAEIGARIADIRSLENKHSTKPAKQAAFSSSFSSLRLQQGARVEKHRGVKRQLGRSTECQMGQLQGSVEEQDSISALKLCNTLFNINPAAPNGDWVCTKSIIKHRRIVTFDLSRDETGDVIPKSGTLFTPKKEMLSMWPMLVSTWGYTAISMIAYETGVLINCSDGNVRFVNREMAEPIVVFSDSLIRCIVADVQATSLPASRSIFYSCRSILKVYTRHSDDADNGASKMPVYAYRTEISAIKVVGGLVYTGHEDGTVSVLSLSDSQLVFSAQIHRSTVFGIEEMDGRIYTCSRDHTVRYIEKVSNSGCALPGNLSALREAGEDAQMPDNSASACPNYSVPKDNSLSPPHYDSVTCLLAYNACLISAGRDCSIKVWKGCGAFKTVPYAHDAWIRAGSVHSDYWATGSKNGVVRLWALVDRSVRCVGKADAGQAVVCMASSEDAMWVGCQKEVQMYKISNKRS